VTRAARQWCRRWATPLLLALALAAAEPSYAELGCEQIYGVLQEAVKYRDQGYSLQQVLAGLKGVDAGGKVTAEELQTLQKSVNAVYLGTSSPEEIALVCRESRSKSAK